MAAHFSLLACKIPWTEEPGRLQSMKSQSWTRMSDFPLLWVKVSIISINEPLLVPDWSKWKCQDTSSFHVHELKWATYKFIELLDSLLIDWQMCHNVNNSNYIVCASSMETPWTVAHQAPLSMEFSRQEYWSGQSFPFPGDLPDPGFEPRSPALQADSLPSEPPGKPWLTLAMENIRLRRWETGVKKIKGRGDN